MRRITTRRARTLGATYALATLPDEGTLRADLQTIVRAYRALTYRGGIDADVESQSDVGDEFDLPASTTVIETRKYAFHRKIERNRTAAKQAKKFHGTVCQACDLDFGQRYGAIGEGFIEAHHLKPIATLEEGVAVHYDIAEGCLLRHIFVRRVRSLGIRDHPTSARSPWQNGYLPNG
jgi:5-methylcytosine-specific restriction protein A